jgi:RNA polymerase sigma-70 factor (ECF subfamily)
MTQPLKRDVDRLDDIDKALLRQIADDRSTVAMQSLYDSYRSRLVPFLRRMTQDHTLIEETYNDVMLTLWNKSDQFKGNSKVSSWIFSIAYRICLRLIKKQQFRQKVLDSFLFSKEEEEGDDRQESGNDEEVDLLNRAIQSLPAKQRIVIELSYFQGYSTQEIGEIADCPTNTVKTRLHHARQKIRAFMDAAKLDEKYNEA